MQVMDNALGLVGPGGGWPSEEEDEAEDGGESLIKWQAGGAGKLSGELLLWELVTNEGAGEGQQWNGCWWA